MSIPVTPGILAQSSLCIEMSRDLGSGLLADERL